MPTKHSLDEFISARATHFAESLKNAAALAHVEEDIRIEVERQLALIQNEAGVELEALHGRHEFTVAKGRIDSLYSRVLIEYKNPADPSSRLGPKLDSPGSRKVVEQIKSRFKGLKDEHGHPLGSLFGVGFDGRFFIFVRFRDAKWDVQEPVELSKYSCERFLWALYNLGQKGKPFSPDYLAADFGAMEGSVAIAGIHALYYAIAGTDHPKAQTFFKQWKILFGEVCGYDVDNPSEKMKKLAATYELRPKGLKPAELLFALHTYYALFMKLLASEIVAFFHRLPTPLEAMQSAGTSAKLKRVMEELEAGSIFRHLNITNFLEGDLFAWYTSVWSEAIEKVVRRLVAKLDEYNPGTLSEDPVTSRDLLKRLYQQLFPKSVRHDLGEYYTPDWLAEHVLNEVGYVGDPDKRLLDPACGSGTFLVMAINRIKAWFEENRERSSYDEGDLCRKILSNVVGFDLNPLAVMAARTNYLIAVRDIVGHASKVELPIYLCDSVMTPAEYGGLFAGALGESRQLKTAAANFTIPTEIATSRDELTRYSEQLEFCVQHEFSSGEFIERCREESLPVKNERIHIGLFEELVRLAQENKNGVWARIIKNAFAPLFVGKMDFVVGNPPWIRWGYLPKDYRDETVSLWNKYGLFSLKGFEARLGSGEKDFSQLFTYSCLDNYLDKGGTLGFLITQTVFRAKGQAEGFRRFQLGAAGGAPFKIRVVDDLSLLKPFDNAANLTTSFVAEKGEPTVYPVPYNVWTPREKIASDGPTQLADVIAAVDRVAFDARPISTASNSQWRTSRRSSETTIRKILGECAYAASVGARIEPYGIFLLKVLSAPKGGRVLVENLSDAGKHEVERVQCQLETEHLYPVVRGKDVERWFTKEGAVVLIVQDPETRRGFDTAWLKRHFPLTFAYVKRFEAILKQRAAFKKYHAEQGHPFYSMFNISRDTFAPYRVAWRRMGNVIRATVLSTVDHPQLGQKPLIASDTVTIVALEEPSEANYLAGLLNSMPGRAAIYSYSTSGRGLGTPSILQHLKIPRYDARNAVHVAVSKAAQALTGLYADGNEPRENERVRRQDALNDSAATFWDLEKKDLTELRMITSDRE